MRTERILLVLLLLSVATAIKAQKPITIHGTGDIELCLGSTLDTSVFIVNQDNASHKIRFSSVIRNVVTGIAVSGDSVPQETTIAASSSLRVPVHYVTDPNKLSELGTFRFMVTVVQLDSNRNEIAGTRDSVVSRFFGIRKCASPYRDFSNNFSPTFYGKIPDQTLWTAYGATVVSGDSNTFDPPPPQGWFGSKDSLSSPVIKFDRRDEYGKLYSSGPVNDSGQRTPIGDTLVSFPINLQGQTRVVLSFDFMRGTKRAYPLLWDNDTLFGPEPTVLTANGNTARAGDSLILEFKDPSDNFCDPTKWNRIVGIDGGHDLTFRRLWLEIVDSSQIALRMTGDTGLTILPSMHYLDASFRFRLRLKANDNGSLKPDDDDAWYVDNFQLQAPRLPEIEAMWVHAVTPYKQITRKEAAAIPIYMKVVSNTTALSPTAQFSVTVADSAGHLVYSNTLQLQSLAAGRETVLKFQDWDAHALAPGLYVVRGGLAQAGYQSEDRIAQTSSLFYLNFSHNKIEELAYDDGINDLPTLLGSKGVGIGFNATSGSYAMKIVLRAPDTLYGVHAFWGSANAADEPIRISVMSDDSLHNIPGDTLHGVQAMFLDKRQGGYFNAYWPYYFPTPIALAPGSYWVGVSQLSLDNMSLGADLSRGGGYMTNADDTNPVLPSIYSDPYGTQSSAKQNNGDVHHVYALEFPAGAGNWKPWMPDTGYWPTNAGGHSMQFWEFNPKFSQYSHVGSYLPMIRAIMAPVASPVDAVARTSANGLSLNAFPNPLITGEPLTLSFTLDHSAHAVLTVTDPLGRVLATLADGALSPGEHFARWDGATPGSYFVRLTTSDGTSVVRMVVVQ